SEVEPGERKPIGTDRSCEDCNAPMVLVRGPYGIFVGCSDYPQCNNRYSVRWGDEIATNVLCSGKTTSHVVRQMVATQGRFGVYLRCPDDVCRATRNIYR